MTLRPGSSDESDRARLLRALRNDRTHLDFDAEVDVVRRLHEARRTVSVPRIVVRTAGYEDVDADVGRAGTVDREGRVALRVDERPRTRRRRIAGIEVVGLERDDFGSLLFGIETRRRATIAGCFRSALVSA